MASRLSPDCGKNEMQFFRFLPKFAGIGFGLRFGGGNHSQPEFGFAGFLAAGADFIFEILFGNRIVGFALIRAHACASTNKLAYQRLRHGIDGGFLCELEDGFAKQRSSLFQIECWLFPAVWTWGFFSHSSLWFSHSPQASFMHANQRLDGAIARGH
jgi:hypothetical protein